MKCYSCGFAGEKKDFGTLTVSGGGGGYGAMLIGCMPQPAGHVGTVDVFVCPKCGALHSDMRGTIADKGERT